MPTNRLPIPKGAWASLIPHRDAMSLLGEVLQFDDERIHLRTDSHRGTDNPLRSEGQLRAVHCCEYGAQAMAVHGSLLAQRDGLLAAPGFLVSLRGVRLHVARIDDLDGSLDVFAERLLSSASSWQYAFRIEHHQRVVAEGRAAVIAGSSESERVSVQE